MFPFQLGDLPFRFGGRESHYQEFKDMRGKIGHKSDMAYDDFAPSQNLRALIQSSQQRRSIDVGDRRRIERVKNKNNRNGVADLRRGSDGSQPSKQLSINGEFWSLPKMASSPDIAVEGHRKTQTPQEIREFEERKGQEGSLAELDACQEVQEKNEPLFHIRGVNDSSTDQLETDERTCHHYSDNFEQKDAAPVSGVGAICEGSYEFVAPPSPKTPTEENPFANPMERLRKRTELGIKESGSLAADPASSAVSKGFYGFPHRRGIVVDGKKMSDNKYCRDLTEPRLHASEPLWVPTFQNRTDVMSQFAPYDDKLNNNGPDDWSVWEVLRTGYPGTYSWISSAIESRHKEKKRRGELERWKHFIAAH